MENENWTYKIGAGLQGFIPLGILLAVFAGVSIWLYKIGNGAFIFTSLLAALVFALAVYSVYRVLFVKVLIGEKGFCHQTGPGKSKYYAYSEITQAWESSGKNSNGTTGYYCCYKTSDGQTVRFPFAPFESEGVEYFLARAGGEGYAPYGDETDEL